jgi:hypothetical protein
MNGMSLVEMMMAIFIMLIAMEGFTLLFLKSFQQNSYILEEGVASANAARVVGNIVADLRKARQADNGAYPVASGDDFDLKVYLDIDNDGVTERVHYYVQDERLYQGVTNPTAGLPVTYANEDHVVTMLLDYVTNTNAQPIFYYYNKDYPSDTVNNPLSTPITVNTAKLIRVHLWVNIDPIRAPNNINIESFAEMRNLNNYAY